MKKTLSYFIVFAFLFSSVFTTGCFDSKNKIFSTRTLGALGLVIAVTATGGTGAALPFAANVRGSFSVKDDNVKVVGYAYTSNAKGEKLFEGTPEFDATSTKLSFKTTAEDEAKLAAHEYYLIEVETKGQVVMSAIYHRNGKPVDSREVEVSYETTAIRHAFESDANKEADFVQFSNNAAGKASILALAKAIDTKLTGWDGVAFEVAAADANAAVADVATDKYYRVYCDELPGTEKDGDFEFVDVSKYFLIEATEKVQVRNVRGVAAPAPTFPIYSDATFDFYLKEGVYTFKVIPKPGETLEDVFGQEIKKTKASNEITINEDKKLTEEDFKSTSMPDTTPAPAPTQPSDSIR